MEFKTLQTSVARIFADARASHDSEHTERVLRLAEHIAGKEHADMAVVRYAALLHDIARHEEDRHKGRISHAQLGAERAAKMLLRLKYPAEFINAVTHCIRSHRYRAGGSTPRTIEAKVLYDADKLDAIGAVGIGRAFQFAGEVGAKLHDPNADIARTKAYTEEDTAYREYMVKLRFIKDRLYTKTARTMAKRRHRFMTDFFRELSKEWRGHQ
ncbi:MAG: HD domain-containing protein [Spirochaetota bacterium]